MREEIGQMSFAIKSVYSWESNWFLLSAGDYSKNDFNMMTVAWGSFGVMWNKAIAMVVVRPNRYTYGFMEDYDTFTLSSFPKEYRKALSVCGAISGRDNDKVKASGITPMASKTVSAPVYKEADLILECKKIYFDDFKPENFLDPVINESYNNDYHRMYFGEISYIEGSEEYRK